MSNILWLSKTSHNGSNKALFESRSKLKSKIHKRAVEQRSLFLWIVQKSKENKGNLTILYFIWENKLKFVAKKSILQFLI